MHSFCFRRFSEIISRILSDNFIISPRCAYHSKKAIVSQSKCVDNIAVRTARPRNEENNRMQEGLLEWWDYLSSSTDMKYTYGIVDYGPLIRKSENAKVLE